jgi:hypothetical protein
MYVSFDIASRLAQQVFDGQRGIGTVTICYGRLDVRFYGRCTVEPFEMFEGIPVTWRENYQPRNQHLVAASPFTFPVAMCQER